MAILVEQSVRGFPELLRGPFMLPRLSPAEWASVRIALEIGIGVIFDVLDHLTIDNTVVRADERVFVKLRRTTDISGVALQFPAALRAR
jgi:hypothetical protein